MKPRLPFIALVVVFVVIVVGFARPHIDHYTLTGQWLPIDKIGSLSDPASVTGWNESELLLEDGRSIRLPEFSRLPKYSAALSEATKRGVEVSADGRVIGLVRIHHWCGNDTVREHIARVDLSHMLTFLREGERIAPAPDPDNLAYETGGQFSEWGWRVGEFSQYHAYCQHFFGEQDAGPN